eukprot:4067049-Pyramimonas_sp.AAC.1
MSCGRTEVEGGRLCKEGRCASRYSVLSLVEESSPDNISIGRYYNTVAYEHTRVRCFPDGEAGRCGRAATEGPLGGGENKAVLFSISEPSGHRSCPALARTSYGAPHPRVYAELRAFPLGGCDCAKVEGTSGTLPTTTQET